MSSDIVFIVAYVLFLMCLLYPPTEAVSAGFTISSLFSSLLGNESQEFVKFHLRRTSLTLFIYATLPLGFLLGLQLYISEINPSIISSFLLKHSIILHTFLTVAILLPILALYEIYSYGNDWKYHPFTQVLSKFADGNCTWQDVASNINIEYLRVEKIVIQTSAICTVIATENWIIKVMPLQLCIAHQSDASLTVQRSDTHRLTHLNEGASQYLTIKVKNCRTEPFTIRINALDFQDLQDRVARSITIPAEIKFYKNIIEKFAEVFKDTVARNPPFVPVSPVTDLDECIGCMQKKSNIKLQKSCEGDCMPCFCKPMWCLNCLATWFAHRQDPERTETWLSNKATCPTCRAKFCILDVSLINADSY